jgi:hypothetical protein
MKTSLLGFQGSANRLPRPSPAPRKVERRLMPQQIRDLGFEWPAEELSPDVIVVDASGAIDLGLSLEQLRSRLDTAEREWNAARSFVGWAAGVSMEDSEDFGEASESWAGKAVRARAGIALLEKILQAAGPDL